jgi:hypothetical protein
VNGNPHRGSSIFPHLQAAAAMEGLLPHLQKMLPAGFSVGHRTPDLTLFIEPEAMQRIATQLVLHGRQSLAQGSITLDLAPVTLGNHSWALLTLELTGRPGAGSGDFLGLTWLQDTVRASLGILELAHDGRGFLWPRIFLPCQSRELDQASRCLRGCRVWIIDHDPLVRDALCGLVRGAGGEAQAFDAFRPFLESARRHALPDILVLERTGSLQRYQARLRRLAGKGVPAILLLGDGRPWAQGHGSSREGGAARLILLEKPFPGQNFLQCLLALLYEPAKSVPEPHPEQPCPPSP